MKSDLYKTYYEYQEYLRILIREGMIDNIATQGICVCCGECHPPCGYDARTMECDWSLRKKRQKQEEEYNRRHSEREEERKKEQEKVNQKLLKQKQNFKKLYWHRYLKDKEATQ